MSFAIVSDGHTHTCFSHGRGTPEDIVMAAVKRGLKRVTITEHAPAHLLFGVRGEKLARLRSECDRLARVYQRDIEVGFGIECDLTGFGTCDRPYDRDMFDIVLLAYHKGVWPNDAFLRRRTFEAFHMAAPEPLLTANALLIAAETYHVTAFSHPGEYVKCDIAALAKGAAELGVQLEINAHHVSMTVDEIRTAHKLGASFVINSDAHSPERVGDFDAGIRMAEEAGVMCAVVNAEVHD